MTTETTHDQLVEKVLEHLATRPTEKLRIVQDESPLGIDIRSGHPGEAISISVEPPENSAYEIRGIRSFNHPEEVWVSRVEPVATGISVLAGPFDAATFSLEHRGDDAPELDECRAFYQAPWGTISRDKPLMITFETMRTPMVYPSLRWTLMGRLVRGIDVSTLNDAHRIVREVVEQMFPESSARVPEIAAVPVEPAQGAESAHAWGIPRAPLRTIMRRR